MREWEASSGFLWELRKSLPTYVNDLLHDGVSDGVSDDEILERDETFQVSLSSLMDEVEMNASNDYSETLSNAAQDELTRGMTGLHIGRKKTYNDLELGLNSEIHPSI